MGAELIVVVVVVAFDRCVLDRAVHPLDLAIRPRMVWLCEAMLDTFSVTDHVKAHRPRINGIPVPGLLSELNAVVRKYGVDLVGHRLEHMLQELPSGLPVCFFDQLGHSKFACAVNANEQK